VRMPERNDSPAIAAANTNWAPAVDFHGQPRPFGGLADMGAEEFVDTDGDGLPDWWEIKHFGGPTNAVASADDDGDKIIIEESTLGLRDELAIVKNFSWNDLQRLGVGNLNFAPQYSSIHDDLKTAIIEMVVFKLDDGTNRDQKDQLNLDEYPDSGRLSVTHTNFQSQHPGLATQDVPSSRGIGWYPFDWDHFHLALETNVLTAAFDATNASLNQAGANYSSAAEFQQNTAALLSTLMEMAYEESVLCFILGHSYEWGQAKTSAYLAPSGGGTPLKPGDPTRNVRHACNYSQFTPHLTFPGDEDFAGAWQGSPQESPQEVRQIASIVDTQGQIVLISGAQWGLVQIHMIEDAINGAFP
jgi:hypothetical protein